MDGAETEAVARRYLAPLFATHEAADTLVLGCTHFPVLSNAIRAVLPVHVRLVDSAATTAAAVRSQLSGHSGPVTGVGHVSWLATDGRQRFARVGSLFLTEPLLPDCVEIIDL